MDRRKALKMLAVGIFGFIGTQEIKKLQAQDTHTRVFNDVTTFVFSSISVDFGVIKEIEIIMNKERKVILTKDIWDAL